MVHGNCKHLLGSLSDYLDGCLEDNLCAEIERHLGECERCRVVVDTLNKTIYLVHESGMHTDVPGKLRERLYKRLNLDDFLDKQTL